jgi:geranylgeranyl reductase family protein
VSSYDYDVIVAGAGPSGSTAAINLARAGMPTLLLDRAEFPREKPCGGGITGRARVQAPVDIDPVVEQRVDKVRFSFRLGPSFDYQYGETLVWMTQRVRLDAYLVEHAVMAGAELRQRDPVRAARSERASVCVTTASGDVTARVLIGADGANGAVARSLGLEPAPDPPVALEANFPYASAPVRRNGGTLPHEWDGVLALELGSMYGGYGWSFPKADHFNVGCGGWRIEGGRLREHLAHLAPHYGLRLDAMQNLRGHHLPTREPSRPISKGNVLLVGDAAGLVDPMSGEGIYSAFVSGRLAADAAIAYLKGKTKTLAPYDEAVERELMPDIRAAGLLRDAYHFMPGPCYAVMKRWPYIRESLCELMLGRKTYGEFLREDGPLRALVSVVGAAGRMKYRRRTAGHAAA